MANSIGLGVGPRDLQAAFSQFDTSGDGQVDLEECVAILFPAQITGREIVATQHLARTSGAGRGKRLEEANTNVLKAVKKIAKVIYEREINLRKQFKKWDKDGSQGLDVNEMAKALNEIGFSVTIEEATIIFDAFDLDGDQTISCWELVRGIGSLDPQIRMTEAQLERERGRREAEEQAANAQAAAAREAEDAARRAAERAAARDAENARRAAAEAEAAAFELAQKEAEENKAQLDAAAAAAEIERLQLELERSQGNADREALRKQQEAAEHQRAEAEKDAALAAAAAKSQSKKEAKRELKRRERELKRLQDDADRLREEARRKVEAEAAIKAEAPLRRFADSTWNTEARECGGYSFKDTTAPKSDTAVIEAIAKRMKALRVQPEDALAQCTNHPALVQIATSEEAKNEYAGYGVDGVTFMRFAKQFFYNISVPRAEQLLHRQRSKAGLDPDGGNGGKDDANVLPVENFVNLFIWDPARVGKSTDGAGGGADGGLASPPPVARLKANKINALTEHEVQLVSNFREMLFERHSKMRAMFEAVDRDGAKEITVEEFLRAMERAGALNLNKGMVAGADQQGHDGWGRGHAEVTEQEACDIVGFFDSSGDGTLDYAEFMAILQDSKHYG